MIRFRYVLLIVSLLSGQLAHAQRYDRHEISAPLHPWTLLSGSGFAQYERYATEHRSWVFTGGARLTPLLYFFFNPGTYRGVRADVGHRWHLRTEASWLQLFAGLNVSVEAGRLTLPAHYRVAVPTDSLRVSGVALGPEVNAGLKITLAKRITLTPMLGWRYYFNTLNTDRLTQNPAYWAYDDWDYNSPDWRQNRSYLNGFLRGHYPVISFNIGYAWGQGQR